MMLEKKLIIVLVQSPTFQSFLGSDAVLIHTEALLFLQKDGTLEHVQSAVAPTP